MNKNDNNINWFEVPVTNLERAKTFYQTIFALGEMETTEMMGMQMAFFPWEAGNGKVAGALVQGEGYKPSLDGSLLYLNAGPDLSVAEQRIAVAGGNVIMPKTGIGDYGFVCFFIDTEGNRMALHSNN